MQALHNTLRPVKAQNNSYLFYLLQTPLNSLKSLTRATSPPCFPQQSHHRHSARPHAPTAQWHASTTTDAPGAQSAAEVHCPTFPMTNLTRPRFPDTFPWLLLVFLSRTGGAEGLFILEEMSIIFRASYQCSLVGHGGFVVDLVKLVCMNAMEDLWFTEQSPRRSSRAYRGYGSKQGRSFWTGWLLNAQCFQETVLFLGGK